MSTLDAVLKEIHKAFLIIDEAELESFMIIVGSLLIISEEKRNKIITHYTKTLQLSKDLQQFSDTNDKINWRGFDVRLKSLNHRTAIISDWYTQEMENQQSQQEHKQQVQLAYDMCKEIIHNINKFIEKVNNEMRPPFPLTVIKELS
jgi:hypothetical protein